LLLALLLAASALPAAAQTATNLARIVAVGGGRASGGNIVVEATVGGVGGVAGVPANAQVQHGFVPQMRPAPPALLGPMLAGGVVLTVFGEDGVSYTLQTSANLSAWTGAGPVRTTNGVARVTLAPSVGPSRFYRVAASE
jgi:hypothetical protein